MSVGGSYQIGKEEITQFLKDRLEKGVRILDVGAGGGTYKHYLGDDYTFEAVEVWKESIEVLNKTYDKVYSIDIRDFSYENDYDLIIFGDVLEHLSVKDAQKVLKKARKHAKAIMVAVPYLYEQEALYGNEAEVHVQSDLTPELFEERYPGFKTVLKYDEYGYYYQDLKPYKKLAVYAICKNELKFLNDWVEHVKEADYICVLDTGSTDGTWEELQRWKEEYPDKFIIKQEIITPWRFDVARNKSMELIPEDAEILFCIDFDEKFNKSDWVDIIRSNWKEDTNRGYYNYAWSHNSAGIPSDIFVYDKLHDRNYNWIYPVHEVLWPLKKDGYTEKSVDLVDKLMLEHFPDDTKSRSFYFDLLKLAVEENPDNPHERMLLAREYIIKGDYETALKEYEATLNMPEIDNPLYRLVLLESLGRVADCYMALENYDEAIWYCQEFIKEDSTYREPYFILGDLYYNMKMYTLAESMYKAGLEYGTRKYNWLERAPVWLGLGYDRLSMCEFQLNKIDNALTNTSKALEYEPDNITLLKRKIELLELKYNKENN